MPSIKLFPELIQTGLKTSIVGRKVYHYTTIDSTNRAAKQYALSGAADGTVVFAEEQTSGKGRLNRQWVSPAGSNILCSIIFYPPLNISSIFRLTMLASVAVVQAIKNVCGIEARIKWPNDVYIGGKKVCGILTEFSADYDKIVYAVVGIGVNVNFETGQKPEIKDIATSLYEESGQKVSRCRVFKALLEEVDTRYTGLGRPGQGYLKREWEQHSMVMDRKVNIFSGNETFCGIAKGISEDGHLILADEKGEEQEILCGDLSLRMDA